MTPFNYLNLPTVDFQQGLCVTVCVYTSFERYQRQWYVHVSFEIIIYIPHKSLQLESEDDVGVAGGEADEIVPDWWILEHAKQVTSLNISIMTLC
jgi:hypothetical protein